jgi:hypothetical protein
LGPLRTCSAIPRWCSSYASTVDSSFERVSKLVELDRCLAAFEIEQSHGHPALGVAVQAIQPESLPAPHGHEPGALRDTRRPRHFLAPVPSPRPVRLRTTMARMRVSTATPCSFASRSRPWSTALGSSIRISRHGTKMAESLEIAGIRPSSPTCSELPFSPRRPAKVRLFWLISAFQAGYASSILVARKAPAQRGCRTPKLWQ